MRSRVEIIDVPTTDEEQFEMLGQADAVLVDESDG
jgi:hypothetical protein